MSQLPYLPNRVNPETDRPPNLVDCVESTQPVRFRQEKRMKLRSAARAYNPRARANIPSERVAFFLLF